MTITTTPASPATGSTTGDEDTAGSGGALSDQLERERNRADQQQGRAQAAVRELDEFKRRVRDIALETKNDQDWCDDGFNRAMRTLGLPELMRDLVGTVTVSVRVTNLEDAEQAERWIRNALHSDDPDVEITDIDTGHLAPDDHQ